MDNLIQHIIANKIEVALWCTRGLTLIFSVFFFIPILWNPYNVYYKALTAYATTSALRLHQRKPQVRPSLDFFWAVLTEDSFHYLVYSFMFFYVPPFTLILIPIFCFSMIHFASYSIRLLDAWGANSMWLARLIISIIEFNARNILKLIAFSEIMIMPFCVILVFMGIVQFPIPFMYLQFLLMRSKSRRNPSTRYMLTELQYMATSLAHHRLTPSIVRKCILSFINMILSIERALAIPVPEQS